MKLLLVCLAALVCVSLAVPHFQHDANFESFLQYTQRFGKRYSSLEEMTSRFLHYKKSLQRVARLNAQNTSATFGINKFSDLSPAEFKAMYLGYKPTVHKNRHHVRVARPHLESTPTSFDWRSKGAVTAVKDQQQCGSCWAFSTTEEIESMWFLKKGQLLELSVQQIVSCDTVDQGCNGGDTPTAYQYVKGAGGLELDSDYPYTSGAGDSGTCSVDTSKFVASVSGFEYATPSCTDSCDNQDETTLEKNLVATGPVSICVYAEVWQDYTGGVLDSNCPHAYTDLDHCVQLVGYNKEGATPYWLVRNSWGESWGEAGYIYLKQGINLCGVADEATFAQI